MSSKVAAVVVTYNRKAILGQCLAAIHGQTRRPDRIIIMDNGSTDGTYDDLAEQGLLTDDTVFVRFAENRGPARAFWQGMSHAYADGADWVWVMDDDIIPDPTALEVLLSTARMEFPDPEQLAFLSSRVRGPEGQPMNTPEVAWRAALQDEYATWEEKLDHGMVQIRRASLTSTLFPRSTLRDVPPSAPDFWMWGEDSDFTMRATKSRRAYLVSGSKVVHLRAISRPLHPLTETDPSRLRRMFFMYRNLVYLRRHHYPPAEVLMSVIDGVRLTVKAALTGRFAAARVVLTGTLAGFWFRPRIPATADPALMRESEVLHADGKATYRPVGAEDPAERPQTFPAHAGAFAR